MELIPFLVSFIIFVVVAAVVILGAKWLCSATGVPEPIAKAVLWILGAIILIVFLLKFVQPFVQSA